VVKHRPDGRIRKGSGTFVGNNIYNTTGVTQTKTGSATRGATITFGVSIQNDGGAAESFTVFASGTATTMYTVRYFRGTTEITTAVHAGTYTTPSLARGATFLINAKVKVKSPRHEGLQRHPPGDHHLDRRWHQAGRRQVHRQAGVDPPDAQVHRPESRPFALDWRSQI